MAQPALDLISLAVILAGTASLALRLLPPRGRPDSPHPAWWMAGWLVTWAFLLYVQVILLGSLGLLKPLPLLALNLAAVALLARRTAGALGDLRTAARKAFDAGEGPGMPRLVLFCLLYTAFLNLATHLPTNDFLSYHLAGILNFVQSGSTAAVDRTLWPLTAPLFYTRGMESILSVFFLFELPREGTVLFGLLGAAVLYLSLRSAVPRRAWADAAFCLLLTSNAVQENILWIKNDLLLGALFVFVLAPVLSGRRGTDRGWLPLAAAVGLLLALKTNGALYAALALAAWLIPRRRIRPSALAALAAVALPPGLYFYGANTLQTGHPLYPYRLGLSGPLPLAGGALDPFTTTILGNLDAELPLLLLRGLLRALGPALLILSSVAVLLALTARVKGSGAPRPREEGGPGAVPWILAAASLLWPLTPFSDNTGLGVHGSLFSGQSLRFAFPALFLATALTASRLPERIRWRGRSLGILAGSSVAASLLWYDLAAMALKPGNAFAALAPVVRTFSNPALLLAAALLAAGSALAALRPRPLLLAAWLATGAALFHLGWPGSLGWTLEFKQLGRPTRAFQLLDSLGEGLESVALHRRVNGALQTGVDYVLPGAFRRVMPMENPSDPPGADVLVYAVEAATGIAGMIEGRRTRLSWDYMEGVEVPAGYRPVLEDPYFRIYARGSGGAPGTGP